MNDDIKHNIKQQSTWVRALYMLLFAIFYGLAEVLIFFIVVFQFLLKLVTGELNERLLKLGQSSATYVYQIIQFLTFNTETHPFPFAPWPKGEPPKTKRKPQKDLDASDTTETVEQP